MHFKDNRLAVEKLMHLVQGPMGCPDHSKPKVLKVVAYFANGRIATLDGFGKCTWTYNAEASGPDAKVGFAAPDCWVCDDCPRKDNTCPVAGIIPEYARRCVHKPNMEMSNTSQNLPTRNGGDRQGNREISE
jgi:hypothetical protein